MSFTDTLKRSLGFEESESSNGGSSFSNKVRDAFQSGREPSNQQYPNPHQQRQHNPRTVPNHYARQNPRRAPVYDDSDYVITPERSYYEIILIRPKTIDDINYVVDQVIEERNPVILDLSFLEKESEANFKLAGDKINQMRTKYGVQALLLARNEDKNLIMISPKKVKLVNKG